MAFEFVLTTEEIREKMFDFLRPEYRRRHDLKVRSINWTDGVYDRESGIFLTFIYEVPDAIARGGRDYYSYIVIMDNGSIFRVDNNYDYEKSAYDFIIPLEYADLSDIIKAGIELCGDRRKKSDYMKSLDDDTHRKLEEIREIIDDRCHRNFPIECENDARKLFELYKCDDNYIRDIHNKATVENFNRYATDEKIFLWREKEHDRILTELCEYCNKHHDEEYDYKQTMRYLSENFIKIEYLMWNGIRNLNTELWCDVIRIISDNFSRFTLWQVWSIEQYVEYYLKNNPDGKQNFMPLVNFTKERGYINLNRILKRALDKE